MMSGLRLLPIAAALLALTAVEAGAQSTDETPDCSTYAFSSVGQEVQFPFQTAACARATVNRQLLIHNIDVIPRVVANSLGIGPVSIEPAGLAGLTAGDFASRLAGGSAIIVSPTADAAPAPAAASWNIWGDGKYTWNDNGPASFDLDGPLWNGLFGIDYKVSSKMTLGIMGSVESSNLDGTSIDLKSDGWGIGPYVGVTLTDNIVFSANLIGSRVDSSQGGGAFEFSSDRVQAAASLTGYWYQDTWRFSPGISLSWSKEWMDEDHGALPDQTIETAMLTPSIQIGDTLRISDQATMEPWAGAALDYTFVNYTDTDGFPSVDDPYADLRLQAGLNFSFGSNSQLAIIGEVAGLLRDDTSSYSAEANLAIQF